MTDVTPVVPSPPNTKRRSIKTKFLFALLALSLLPLVAFVTITRSAMRDLREDIKADLIRHAHEDIFRLAKSQAALASAMLDKVKVETQTVAFFAGVLLRDPAAFGHTRSWSANETPEDISTATKYVLAPGLSMAAAQPMLDLTSNLDSLLALVAKDDSNLGGIYYGTQSGVYRQHPWSNKPFKWLMFILDPAFAQPLNDGGKVPALTGQAFKQHGMALSPQAVVTTIDPDNQWVISDDESSRVFSLQREKTGIAVYSAYDPRIRPWYRGAVGLDSVAWTKYADWDSGKFVFSIGKELAGQIGDKVSHSLAREFARHKVALAINSQISIRESSEWALQDKNGNNYEIREVEGKLNVYNVDILTCSRAVLDPEGRLAGVVGLDISTESIRSTIFRTSAEVEGYGYAFLLNDKGVLIDQETPDMFIPAFGSDIRAKMIAGNAGTSYDAAAATHVAYAPIRSISPANGKSSWSVGISTPESEITRIANNVEHKMSILLELMGGVGAAMFIFVIVVAQWMSRGITGPIEVLGAGVARIGGGDLDYRLAVRTGDEIEELANAFNKMAHDLKTYVADLKTTTAQKERFAGELQAAHDIQMSFLKKIFPAFPHRSDFSLYATLKPAKEVSGDLYDFSLLDDTRLFFYVGDVSGKGVPASLFMAITMRLMKRASEQPGITPAGILRQVNADLSTDNESSMFVTLFLGILDLKTGEVAISNAGHNPPLILGAAGECRFLTLPEGLVLGVMTDAEYRDATVQLPPGAMIVTYTDGVTEAMNPAHKLYSDDRLLQTLTRLAGRDVRDTVREIVASVEAHAAGEPQSDDITVLALRRS